MKQIGKPFGLCGPLLLLIEGSGPGGGAYTKTNSSVSETKDSSVTAGGDAYGGVDASFASGNVNVNSDKVALAGLETVKEFAKGGAELLKTFATSNLQLADSTNQRLSGLAETKLTDGASGLQKTVLVALAIGGAIVVLPSLLRRK